MQKKKKEAGKAYSYEELLLRIRTHIDEKYGGVAKFLHHEDYITKCGFDETERAKMFTYLSLRKDGSTHSRIKSFPVVKTLYETLLGIELSSVVTVTRTQAICGDAEKIDALAESQEVV